MPVVVAAKTGAGFYRGGEYTPVGIGEAVTVADAQAADMLLTGFFVRQPEVEIRISDKPEDEQADDAQADTGKRRGGKR